MFKVVISRNTEQAVLETESETTISVLIRRAGLLFSMPCSGNHTCGKCKVKVLGKVSGITAEEAAFLSEEERRNGIRLACFAKVQGDASVELPDVQQLVTLDGRMGRFNLSPMSGNGYGVAFDIGTTTVAGYLYRLSDGKLCATLGEPNQQATYGADVISRIQYAGEYSVTVLCDAIRRQLCNMIERLAEKEGKGTREISCAVVAGNTTMLHFLTGLDPSGIAQYPFVPQSLFGCEWPSKVLPVLETGTQFYLPGCISSYVGADITCSVLASGMMYTETSLLLDLGTNGEMALWKNGACIVCSTAVGPAFEGAGIHHGMPAGEGAINAVFVSPDGEISYTTIGGGDARGICGSGIIDALSVFLAQGLIDETGRIDDDQNHKCLCSADGLPALRIGSSGIVVTQQDIRQIQLAKAAVAAGIQTLLHHTKTRVEEIETLYLAGGFGNYIHPKEAAFVGLFPDLLLSRIETLGNAAGAGASLLMLDENTRREQQRLLKCASEISLSADPFFMDAYVEQMMFE